MRLLRQMGVFVCCIVVFANTAVAAHEVTILTVWNLVYPERCLVSGQTGWKMIGGTPVHSNIPIVPEGEILVDLPNGYLTCSYISGSVRFDVVAALFIAKNDVGYLIASHRFTGLNLSGSYIQAYRFANGHFSEANSLLPDIGLKEFLDENWVADNTNSSDLMKNGGTVYYELPRIGATVIVKPTPFGSVEEAGVQLRREDVARAISIFRNQQKYKSIRLSWNEITGTFSIEGKDLM